MKVTTTRFKGKKVDVYLGVEVSDLADSTRMDNIESVEWKADPNFKSEPEGLGSDLKTIVQELPDFAGSLSRWANADTDVCSGDTGHIGTSEGSGTFAAVVGAYQNGLDVTPLHVKIVHKITGETWILNKCSGKYSTPISSPEGDIMEKWDFLYESITYTGPTTAPSI